MARKEVKQQEALKEEPIGEDLDVDGDELFEGLESMSSD